MDPNVLLEALRRQVKMILDGERLRPDELEVLATRFEALDGWLSRKGFLPAAWHGAEKQP